MLQLIGREKFYLYFFFILTLLSFHNISLSTYFNDFFKIKKIIVINNFEKEVSERISESVNKFNGVNIFSIEANQIFEVLNNFNLISELKINKEYPSTLKIELKEAKIFAYFIENNRKYFLGDNGKKIQKNLNYENIPLIVGNIEIKSFLDLRKKLVLNDFNVEDFTKFYSYRSNRWDLVYKNKVTFKLPIDDLDSSLVLLKEIINNMNLEKVNIIDLRIKNNVILS